MKKIIFIILSIFLTVNFCYASEGKEEGTKKNVLVVYYSWSGNTKEVAKQINSKVNGTLFEIDTKVAYPKDYKATVEQAKKEIADKFRPELKDEFNGDISKYDTIFIGSPNWWGTVAPVLMTFIEKYDLSGKTIIPFITHGSGGEQNTVTDLKAAIKNATFKDALILNGGLVKKDSTKEEIAKWLKDLGY